MIMIDGTHEEHAAIERALSLLGPQLRSIAAADNIHYRFLKPTECFADIARAYRSADNMLFAVCEGLYDPDEHRIVIAVPNLSTIVHETLHHFDHRLAGGRGYRSTTDERIIKAYRRHRKDGCTISAYAGVNSVEFAAESWRSLWVSRTSSRRSDLERLTRIDPELVALMRAWTDEAACLVPTPSRE